MRRRLVLLCVIAAMVATVGPARAGFIVTNCLDHILFTSDRDGDFDIYLMNPDGSGQRLLTCADG